MKPKDKLIVVVSIVIVLGILSGFYYVKNSSATEITVEIVDYDYSICTQDIPTSACGPYNVTVKTADAQTNKYIVAGFSNQESKLYGDISTKISNAKKQNTKVTLKINDNGEIIAVD